MWTSVSMNGNQRISTGKLIFVVSITLLVSALVSCSSVSKGVITGKWKSLGPVGNGDIVEFTSTGTFTRTFVDQTAGKTMSGRYTLIDSTRVEVDFDLIDNVPIKIMKNVKLGPLLCVIKIRGDKLDLTNPNGEIEHFEKVKEP